MWDLVGGWRLSHWRHAPQGIVGLWSLGVSGLRYDCSLGHVLSPLPSGTLTRGPNQWAIDLGLETPKQ